MLNIEIDTCNMGNYVTGENCKFPTVRIRGSNRICCMNKKCLNYDSDVKDLYLAGMMEMLTVELKRLNEK